MSKNVEKKGKKSECIDRNFPERKAETDTSESNTMVQVSIV